MILTIDKKEKDNFNKACALHGAQVSFYTNEKHPCMLKVEVLDSGREIDLFTAYAIGRETGMEKYEHSIF